MGLDQYAFSAPEPLTVEVDSDGRFEIKGVHGEEFQWRKHAQLQAFFEDEILSEMLTPLVDGEFNCNPVQLTLRSILRLEHMVKMDHMPHSQGGFFFGHQFQDESAAEYKEQDLKFCKWAKQTIKEGDYVYYDCWW
tara:strand:+ start:1599 stop:2006 length:408 start_codon:yes stop_codon:yes gene_type:complete